jgi:hypothetical protein
MKFALGRTSQSQQPVAAAPGSAASTALQQSSRQQQQARQLQALKHGKATLIQHKPDESMVSQQAALEDEEPMQGKFETAQKMGLEDEEPMQGKFDATVQRQPDEEEPLQGKFEPGAVNQRQADAAPANNTGMPDQLKSGIESLSGYAMDDVKVHYNSAKPAQMQAHAYAQGTDIHIAPGQEQHLPHEAWHVVQQKQGRVQATTQLKGEAINDDPGLEHEADVMGAKAVGAAQILQGGFSQIGYSQKASSVTSVNQKSAFIQAKFIGSLGPILTMLTPEALGATGTYYNSLWTTLNNSDIAIKVENAGGMAGFEPTTKTLKLKQQALVELLQHSTGNYLPSEVVADHVALVTHELSHAHDSVIGGKELRTDKGASQLDAVENVLMTEVLAWEREARTRQRLLPGDKTDLLWASWISLDENMLTGWTELKANKATNEVVDRYYRYFMREMNSLIGAIDVEILNDWFTNGGVRVAAEVMHLSKALRTANDTI